MKRISLISLGCSKNTVDSEAILGMVDKNNYAFTNDLEEADLIIINTCGFIEDAKVEAINTILDAIQYNKKVIVLGCLVERYKEELIKEIPEVSAFVSLKEYPKLATIINNVMNEEMFVSNFDIMNRVVSTPNFTAYLKISEGCDNFCAFCAIPFIRGRFKSEKLEDLVAYSKKLANEGYHELVVISQDTVNYGKDLKDGSNLIKLLKELEKIDGIDYIRVLYTYPDGISDDYIKLVNDSKKIAHYFDIPLQHISTNVLKRMNRHDTKESIENLYFRIKKYCPDAILRTTLIAGFPGETEEDFNELKEFIKNTKFNHLGCFTYSMEEGTRASLYKDQIEEEIKIRRKNEIMDIQKRISYELNKDMIGRIYRAMILSQISDNEYEVRCDYNAPDDIDGRVILKTDQKFNSGDFTTIKITHAYVYDLISELA